MNTLSLYKHRLCLLFQVYLNQQDRRIDQKPEYVDCTVYRDKHKKDDTFFGL